MEAILQPLIRSPRFLGYVDELNQLRHREAGAREEFRRTLDEDVRAEFINGEVIVHITARDHHTLAIRDLGRLLDAYTEIRKLGTVRAEQALTAFTRNDYAPDICFWAMIKAAVVESANTIVYPVPDFIAEVLSPSTESRDRGVKFEDYAAHGVGEYWIVDADSHFIEQYIQNKGRFELLGKHESGSIQSAVITGLHMPVAAAFDKPANLSALRDILKPS